MSRSIRNQSGFSLVEMLAAMAVIGFVLGGVLLLQQQGQQAYLFGSNRVEVQQNARVALERMARDLRAATSITTAEAANLVFASKDSSGNDVPMQYQLTGTDLNRTCTCPGDPTDGTLTLIGGVGALAFTYKTQAGTTTSTAADVRMIDISITTETEESVASYAPGNRAVTADTTVRLRNIL